MVGLGGLGDGLCMRDRVDMGRVSAGWCMGMALGEEEVGGWKM